MLRARGVSHHDRQDLAQEVALRAYQAFRRGEITTSLVAWCKATARNASVDRVRRDRHLAVGVPAPEREAPERTEDRVLGRLRAEGLLSAWQQLDEVQQARLVEMSTGEDVRERVARHRARKALRALTDSLTLGLLGWIARIRRAAGEQSAAASWTVAAASVAIAAVLLPGAGVPAERSDSTERSAVHTDAPAAPAAPARGPVVVAAHPSPRAQQHVLVRVPVPGSEERTLYTRPSRPDDPLGCVNLAPGQRVCVPHPLRQPGAFIPGGGAPAVPGEPQ